MRALLAILILLLAGNAHAVQPTCLLGIEGKTAAFMPRWERGAEGHHVYWWCVRADGFTTSAGFSCRHGDCDFGAFNTNLQTITASADKVATARAIWDAGFSYTCDAAVTAEQTPRGALCSEREAILATNSPVWLAGLVQPGPVVVPPPPPPAPVYTHAVKANGLVADRPARLLTGGVLAASALSGARAMVGQPCHTTGRPTYPSGVDVWAEYGPDFVAGRVALCAANPTR